MEEEKVRLFLQEQEQHMKAWRLCALKKELQEQVEEEYRQKEACLDALFLA